MDFPNFDNNENNQQNNQQDTNDFNNQQQFSNFDNQQNNNFDNQQNNNFDQQNMNFGGENEIQIENMEFSNNEKTNPPMNQGMSQGMEFNEIPNQMDSNPMGNFDDIDDEERNRIQARKEEEEARRAKIMKKMNDEMRIKQEFRDKAREYAEHWNEYF